MKVRKYRVIEWLKLLSDRDEQDAYFFDETEVNIVTVMIEDWFDELFLPDFESFREIFTEKEMRVLNEFNEFFDARTAKLPEYYPLLRKDANWKEISKKASQALTELGWDEIDLSKIEIEYPGPSSN